MIYTLGADEISRKLQELLSAPLVLLHKNKTLGSDSLQEKNRALLLVACSSPLCLLSYHSCLWKLFAIDLLQILNIRGVAKCLRSLWPPNEWYYLVISQHVAEIPFENEWVVKTRGVDHGTVTHLNNIGLLSQNLLAAHSVWVNPSEVVILTSLLRLGSNTYQQPLQKCRMVAA